MGSIGHRFYWLEVSPRGSSLERFPTLSYIYSGRSLYFLLLSLIFGLWEYNLLGHLWGSMNDVIQTVSFA